MTSMNQTGDFRPVANVDADIPCRRCGYNLRGLPIAGRCPECASPIGVSIRGERLHYSEPNYLRALRRGMRYIIWGIAIMVGAGIVNGTIAIAAAGTAPGRPIFSELLGLVGYVPTVIGGWLLTARDPGGVGEDRYGTSRKLIRITLLIGIANNGITLLADLAGPFPPFINGLLITIAMIAAIGGLIGQFAELNYLSKLALRIPNYELSRSAGNIMWGIGISYGILLALGVLVLLAMAGGSASSLGGAMPVIGCGALIAGIVLLCYGLAYISMLVKFGRELDVQAQLAEHYWTQQLPTTPADYPI